MPYENARKLADPNLDDVTAYRKVVNLKLLGHFEVVQDEFRPRVEGLSRPKLTATKVGAQLRQAMCRAATGPGNGRK